MSDIMSRQPARCLLAARSFLERLKSRMSQSREYFLQFFPALPRSPGMKFPRGCFVISDVLVRAVTGRLAKTVCTWGRPVDRMFCFGAIADRQGGNRL